MRWFWTLVVVMLVQVALPPSAYARSAGQAGSGGCLDALANQIAGSFGAGSGYEIVPRPKKKSTWAWDEEAEEWNWRSYGGFAVGVVEGTTEIWLWPEVFGGVPGGDYCTPGFLADVFPTLAHEILHFLCPGHPGPPEGVDLTNPAKKPDVPGNDPGCNEINYGSLIA